MFTLLLFFFFIFEENESDNDSNLYLPDNTNSLLFSAQRDHQLSFGDFFAGSTWLPLLPKRSLYYSSLVSSKMHILPLAVI